MQVSWQIVLAGMPDFGALIFYGSLLLILIGIGKVVIV